ncbi:cadherin-like domain-containing protein, partial [Pseudomonas sp. BN411]|uniref:cadherin-like domain-containing protein n=1 Tax=Pseudomonas sp. BN411 TaxID=2567887 RepID=UPI002458CDF5
MAISTVSFGNTPQANCDSFLYENLVQDGLDYICLDVMANDLGGKAKTLYSLDDGVTADGSTATRTEIQADLLARDQDCTSAYGAHIWIGQDPSDGKMKVLYDASDLLQSAAYRSLSVGEYLNDSFTYAIRMGNGTLSWATATVRIAGVNDAPVVNGPVTLAAIAEDSGARLITQAELLAHASDIDGDGLTASNLQISSGNGSLVNNGNGTWTYTPALNDDTQVSFTYSVSDGSLSVAGSATLDITPVNDAPTTTPVTLAAIAEDSGARLITQAQLLANAADVDSLALTASNLQISAGNGSLVNNGNGTWTYTPALNDDTQVSFTYTISDGSLTTAGSASLDITPVNDAPTTTPVTLTAIAEDSGARLITQAQLLVNAADVDGPALTATNLQISAGSGSLVNNGNGTWSYTPALNDDTQVAFTYTVSDGSLTASGSATLDITPVNDAPTTTPVTLTAIAEDSGARLITQAQLLANAADVDGPALTATNLQISAGSGSLVNNGNGTWTYTPALNDDTQVAFTYTVSDGSLTAAGSASLDITPVNDAPTTSDVTLAVIAEDSGVRLITQAELLANADDIEGDALTASGLTISSGGGTLTDNGDGTWNYTPDENDDSEVSFSYTISDGDLTVAGSASLDITPVN